MDAAAKVIFDAKLLAEVTSRNDSDIADRLTANFATFDDDQKKLYLELLLADMKKVLVSCAMTKNLSYLCKNSAKLRADQETVRNTDNYYTTMTDAQRVDFDLNYSLSERRTILLESLKAIDAVRPEAGKEGSKCSAESKCTDEFHCCGTATPT